MIHEPLTSVYLIKKILKILLRKLSLRRKGSLIALIGVNGSGKSTLSRKIIDNYRPILEHLGKKSHLYYYGWNPTFPPTKLLSSFNKKYNITSFQSNINLIKPKSFDLVKELLFVYNWIEYIYRYFKKIGPKLATGDLVLTDRYFYDLFGQDLYSRKSILLKYLIRTFPAPNYIFILDANLKTLFLRGKTDKNSLEIKTLKRQTMPKDYLSRQRDNYLHISRKLGATIINTDTGINSLANRIIYKTWSKLL